MQEDSLDHPEIRISIEAREPVAGRARLGSREAVPFQGWLDLLWVLSELLAEAQPARDSAESSLTKTNPRNR